MNQFRKEENFIFMKKKQRNSVAFSPQENYADWAAVTSRRS
jgi:hypothetical protein